MILAGFFLGGCAEDDQSVRQLNRQQAATLESLNAEVVKLNRELEGLAGSRGALGTALPVLQKALAAELSRGSARVSSEREGLVVTLRNSGLFDPEGNQLLPAGEEALSKIAAVLSGELSGHQVAVQGHTDDRPVEGPEGVTNWEYAVDCATAVLHYFVDAKGLSAGRFEVSSFGEYRPIASNGTEDGRDQNRRVAIVILP